MIHLYQEVPEEPVVILGSGDLGLILAADLSQKGIRVGAIKMTRDEVKFSSVEELTAQIARDCEEAKAFHGL